MFKWGFPGGGGSKEPTCQCKRPEMWVRSSGQEDPLEEEMATHFSDLAWRIPWTGYNPIPTYNPQGPKEADMTEAT